MQVITSEIPIFLRENFNGMYRTDVYFLSKTLADLPIYIFFPYLYLTIPYFAIGFNPAVDRYFIAAGIIILVANVATSIGKKTYLKYRILNYRKVCFRLLGLLSHLFGSSGVCSSDSFYCSNASLRRIIPQK